MGDPICRGSFSTGVTPDSPCPTFDVDGRVVVPIKSKVAPRNPNGELRGSDLWHECFKGFLQHHTNRAVQCPGELEDRRGGGGCRTAQDPTCRGSGRRSEERR